MKSTVESQLMNGLRMKQPCGQQRREKLVMSSSRKVIKKLLSCIVVLVLVVLVVMGRSMATDMMENDDRETEWSQRKDDCGCGENSYVDNSCPSSNISSHTTGGESSSYSGSCSSSNVDSYVCGCEQEAKIFHQYDDEPILRIDDEPDQLYTHGSVSSGQRQPVRSFIVDDAPPPLKEW